MSRPDKAVEPSMEEILASIRKIISEEPLGPMPGPADRQPPADSRGAHEPAREPKLGTPTSPLARRAPESSDPVGIDDVLNLAQGLGGGATPGPARDLARPIGAREQAPGSGAGAEAPAVRAGIVPSPREGTTTRSAGSTSSPLQPELNGHGSVDEAASPAGHSDEPEAPMRPSMDADADAALSEARARIDRHLNTPAKGDADRAPLPGLKSVRDAEFLGAKPRAEADATTRPVVGSLTARVAAAGVRADTALVNGAAHQALDARPAAARPGDGAIDAAKPDGGLTPSDRATPPEKASMPSEPVKPLEPAKAQIDAKSEDSSKADDAPQAPPPTAREEAKPAPQAQAAESPAPAVQSSERARTFEDAVAEMLRPMLREWLDANLPRMVQQVLREEMARSPLPGKDNRDS